MTPAERIRRLVDLKSDDTTLGQMTYLDVLFTELAIDIHNQADLNRTAPLLDACIEELAWARLAHPRTGTTTNLGTGHRTGGDHA
jgi:hypothetical protein